MECQIRSLAESSNRSEPTIPSGKVESVCKEWLIREDGVLAYKLQSEEIEHHYGHNKSKNQLVRSDFQEARVAQQSEEEKAEMMQKAYEQMLIEQENADALIAKQIQEKILQEELEKQKKIEEEDKKIALEIQKREKLKLQKKREERELRQVEKMKAVRSESSNSDSHLHIYSGSLTKEAVTNPLDHEFLGLCIEPPHNLTEEELRKFREHQDAELAKYLQEQEIKKRTSNTDDQRLAIEAQDRELAKILQDNERAKAKRAKEKARQKALQQQLQQQTETNQSDGIEKPVNGNPSEDYILSPLEIQMKDNEIYSSFEPHDSYPRQNIAMALDPTYPQKKTLYESPSTSHTRNSPFSSPEHYLRDPTNISSGFTEGLYVTDINDETIAPPYMPIQGQRRPQTLEKMKKNKKHKEGCKTQ